jgi:hypothetical protein
MIDKTLRAVGYFVNEYVAGVDAVIDETALLRSGLDDGTGYKVSSNKETRLL